jgi:succinate dehydrogenase / fumarate reductase cytochrome b subunit
MLDASLASEQGFARMQGYLQLPLVKLAALVFIWSYCHHFCAGIRFLLLDLHLGVELRTTRITSAVVIVAALLMTAFFGARLW